MNEKPTHVALFAGIGGFSLAAEWCGFRTIAYSEIDPAACTVNEYHWPEAPNLGDIRNIRKHCCGKGFLECNCTTFPLDGVVDLLTAGVPCQPASNLGKRRGTSDERWLWPEALRVVSEFRPRFCLFENPPAILTLEGGRAWNGIVSELSALGYDLWWETVPAAAVGAGHLRERLFLIAADANITGLEGHARNEDRRGGGRDERRSTSASPFQGLDLTDPLWFETQSPVFHLVDGLPGRLVEAALRCVGNAVVPQVAEIFLREIFKEIRKLI